jgi:hypothetical protein
VLWTRGRRTVKVDGKQREGDMAEMDVEAKPELPEEMREGDVLVYMSGRLLVVDHLVPEALTIDLVELQAADAADAGRAMTPLGD